MNLFENGPSKRFERELVKSDEDYCQYKSICYMISNAMFFQIVVFENVIATKLTLIKCSCRPFCFMIVDHMLYTISDKGVVSCFDILAVLPDHA